MGLERNIPPILEPVSLNQYRHTSQQTYYQQVVIMVCSVLFFQRKPNNLMSLLLPKNLSHWLCWAQFANSTQIRNTWDKQHSAEDCVHYIDCGHSFLIANGQSWSQPTVVSLIHGQEVLSMWEVGYMGMERDTESPVLHGPSVMPLLPWTLVNHLPAHLAPQI